MQRAFKRLFKFSPHPTYASALPVEIKTHEISVKKNKKRQKLSLTLLIEKDNEIFIVFGTNIFDVTGH